MDEPEQERVKRYMQHISPVGVRIYNLIKDSRMTKADIRKRTSLPAKQIDDELNSLSSYNLIKALKKGQKKNIKTWVLYHEKEDEQQEQKKANNEDLISLILKKDSTLLALKKQAIKHAYTLEGFDEIIEMLKMRGQIFVAGEEVKLRTLKKTYVPCITCQLQNICGPDNIVNANTCPYLLNW